MQNLKYLILSVEDVPTPVVFAAVLSHKAVADKMNLHVLGAGFVRFLASPKTSSLFAAVFGESDSLNIASRPEDGEVIETFFR